MIRRITKARLGVLGYPVIYFPTGSVLIAKWVTEAVERPSLVLVDQNMPGITGIDTGVLLRTEGYAGRLVLYTADDSRVIEEEAMCCGFDAVIRKPASAEALAEQIAQVPSNRAA